MRKYNTYAELETLLLTAIGLPGSNIKRISAATGIKTNTLYKWKTTPVHLSPDKADRLLLYFLEHEPERLALAEKILSENGTPPQGAGFLPFLRESYIGTPQNRQFTTFREILGAPSGCVWDFPFYITIIIKSPSASLLYGK